MELRHLRYFVAVAEELHFRRAAARLYVAQPALSDQIRNLEREFGVQLFERSHRAVSLTPPGAVLLAEARRMLRLADDACRMTRQAQAGVLTRLRVGRPLDVLPAAIPRALRRFSAGYPDVDITVESHDPRAALEAVRDDLLDVALVCLPAPLAGLSVTALGTEGVVVALPEAHPAGRLSEFPIALLDGAAPILLPRETNPPFSDGIVSAALAAGITLRVHATPAKTVEQALVIVASGSTSALLPSSVADRYVLPGVRFLPLAAPAPRTPVALVTASGVERIHTARFVKLAAALERSDAAPRFTPRPQLTRAA